MADQSNIQSAASKSIRPFKSSEEYLYAMKEDLAEWLNTLYELDITADTFIDGLETGCALCRHANNVNRAALEFQMEHPEAAQSMKMPCKDVVFLSRNVVAGSFLARDNVSNFIAWCRQELWIKDVLMFETNDLVERCNEKNLVLCLLEVARRGAKFGMLAPMLIQLEEEIEEEIRDQENLRDTAEAGDQSPPSRCFSQKEIRENVEEEPDPIPFIWQQKRVLCDMRNLDELVREILGRCSCPAQFPMTKVSEGKYKVGDSSSLIFIRVLRTHVMVRVGGGWDTLEHYLDKHDPCRCNAFAHRYHQAKASGQGGHSKSSSAHSSRSTSPGPHWRNEGIAPYKPPDRRPLEPACAPGASSSTPSSSSSTTATRPGRSHHPSAPAQRDSSAGPALLPRPPRDRSEPRHFNPLRSKETVARRLSGDSDSSTASSKGGGGGGGGGRYSLGNASRRPGEEVVLLVNRKEGRHVIERPAAGGQSPALRPPLPRTRSHSRERPAPAPTPGPVLRPTPPQVSHGPERGRSLGIDGPRRLQGLRSHSQGKPLPRTRSIDASPGPALRYRDPPPSDRREELRTKAAVAAPSSPRPGGGFARKQSSSCSNSPIKGSQSSSSSPSKKSFVSPRPPAPHSPSVGKARLLPSVATGGRLSPHSSPRNSQHHGPRSPRTSHSPRSVGRGHHRGLSLGPPEHREPEEEEEEEEEKGLGFGFRMLPAVDPQMEQDLYRSFEAELLANTQQVRGGPSRAFRGVAVPHFLPSCVRQGPGTPAVQVAGDPNVTDSAYCSSNSSTSSVNVGAKVRALPDLRDCKRTAPPRHLPLEDPLSVPHDQGVPGGLHNGIQGDWFERGGGLKKLPAISSSAEERELLLTLPVIRNLEPDKLMNQVPSQQPPFHNRNINSVPSAAALTGQQNQFIWGSEAEGDVPLDEQQPNLPYDMEEDDDLPPPEAYTSPVALPPSEDCSFRDSSSENSSMCFSLSESRSEASPPPLANGDSDDDALLQSKTGSKKSDGEVPSVYKLKLGPRVRPRTDNRPDNSPSRIPTPVSYRDLQAHQGLSPRHTPPLSPQSVHSNGHPISRKTLHQAFTDLIHPQPRTQALGNNECAYPGQPGSLDTEAWM